MKLKKAEKVKKKKMMMMMMMMKMKKIWEMISKKKTDGVVENEAKATTKPEALWPAQGLD